MVAVNCRSVLKQTASARLPAGPEAPRTNAQASRTQAAFSLVELLVVVAIIGILSAIAVPQFMAARRAVEEKAVVSSLRTMVANQQLFHLSPIPLPPSSVTDQSRRFARRAQMGIMSL